MYNSQYYSEKRQKLTQLEQENIRRYIQYAFDFVSTQQDLRERFQELLRQEEESKKETEKKIEKKK